MSMAEQIACEILLVLGFREPQNHPDWKIIIDKVQDYIDANIEGMKRVAYQELKQSQRGM